MPSRASNAVLTVASREARDIEISLASDFVRRGALSGFGDGESRLPTASSQRTSPPVIAGLDPAIHPFRRTLLRSLMDARIKSGHECVLEDVLSERCKSVLGLVATPQSKVTASLRGGVGSNWR